MTRKEEIRKASIDFQVSVLPRAIGGGIFADLIERCNVNPSFIAGAEWSDRTILERICTFIEENAYKYGKVKYVNDNKATFDFRTKEFIESLRKAMEDKSNE